MPAGKHEGAVRHSWVGEKRRVHLQWVEVSCNCSLGDLAGLKTNKKENKLCILFLPLRKDLFKKEKIKKND